ncbi:hypothetical protein JVT61DRAFT_10160 [Boletus reticuloceps]|uniref:Uncharacterized protein n=1 Tax=Boletus reticuloceps TaxID=495285 RepID=A0A8I2YZU1_9AGAM|nr:hypothetical protein JVT61DRAFT_10160 [Boletus reticuloceps]
MPLVNTVPVTISPELSQLAPILSCTAIPVRFEPHPYFSLDGPKCVLLQLGLEFHGALDALSTRSCSHPHHTIGFYLPPLEADKNPVLEPFAKDLITTPQAWQALTKVAEGQAFDERPTLYAVVQACVATKRFGRTVGTGCQLYQDCLPPSCLSQASSPQPPLLQDTPTPEDNTVGLNNHPSLRIIQMPDSPIRGRATLVKLESKV